MNWFYANAGQQAGPINEADFERLAREGVIQPSTLVWREGMANWEPYSAVVPNPPVAAVTPFALTPAVVVPPGQVACHECKRPVLVEDTMQINGLAICAACKPIYLQRLREGTAPSFASQGPQRYAGFWIRFAAYLIDYLIMTIIQIPVTVWYMGRMQRALQGGIDWESYFASMGITTSISILVAMTYNWFFVARYAATPGKMMLKLKIVTPDGGKVSAARALGRAAGHLLNSFTCLVGYIIAAFDDEKRALHDRICNTRVVYK